MQDDQQAFMASQGDLDRAIQNAQLDNEQANIILQSQQDAINQVLMDGDLTPEAKRQAIKNIQEGSAQTVAYIESISSSGSAVAATTVANLFNSNKELFAAGPNDPAAFAMVKEIVDYGKESGMTFEQLVAAAQAAYPDEPAGNIQSFLLPVFQGTQTEAAAAPVTADGGTAPTTGTTTTTDPTRTSSEPDADTQAIIDAHILRSNTAGGEDPTPEEIGAAVTNLKNQNWTPEQIAQLAAEQYNGTADQYIELVNQYYYL
jgi:hypothetical protein